MLDFNEIMTPVWKSDIIYDESFTMVNRDGKAEARLLFEPEEIISVTSADKTAEYVEGRDYVINGDVISLTSESRIFCFNENDLIFDNPIEGRCFRTDDGRYSLFREGHFFHDRQISVTYKKKCGELKINDAFCGSDLPRTIEKLNNKEQVKIVLYGDSISAGANSSGMTLTTPFLPTWGSLFAEKLRRHYGADVELTNTAVGGKETEWGIENASQRAAEYNPDLVIIAFGMNDRIPKEKFAANINKITNIISAASPKTEFLLCATTLPNKILPDFYSYQEEYFDALMSLKKMGTAVANFAGMQKALLSHKRFIDLTGNNVNHPNDFFIRCHAQLICEMLIK